MSKKKVLIFVPVYLPGYKSGGPIRSISNIVDLLSDSYDFYIVTKDRDSHETKPYPNVIVNEWNKVGDAHVYYTNNPSVNLLANLIKEKNYHLLYLNSYFSFKFSVLPLIINNYIVGEKRIKVCLAPRGEFSMGALKLKYYKKLIFIYLSNFLSLHKGVLWQASSEYEKEDILRFFNKAKIKIAPNIPTVYERSNKTIKFNGHLKLIFLSRISPKKNLHYALEILSKVTVKIDYHIYGVIDDETYWKKCLKIIDELPLNIKVKYMGSVPHNEVSKTLSQYHVFFMPTKGENYGHAIVESFMSGIPVLISDTTPWKALKEKNVGWDIPLESRQSYIDTIENLYLKKENGFSFQGDKIKKWILEELNLSEVEELNRELFS